MDTDKMIMRRDRRKGGLLQIQARKTIEVDLKLFDHLQQVGTLEKLKTDSQILRFLIQQYECMRKSTKCCSHCSTPLTLFCTKCLLPAGEMQVTQRNGLNSVNTPREPGTDEAGSADVTGTTRDVGEETDEHIMTRVEDKEEEGSHAADIPIRPFKLEITICEKDEGIVSYNIKQEEAAVGEDSAMTMVKLENTESLPFLDGSAPENLSSSPIITSNSDVVVVKPADVEFITPVSLRSDQPLGLPHRKKYKKGEKPSRCSVCEVLFPSRQLMKQHRVAEHSVERPYKCSLCSAAFKIKKHRKDHMLSHTGEKPFLCTVCGMGFSFHCGLKTHMRTHTKERPFVCKTCGAAFYQSSALKVHVRTHTGEKPYVCNVCNAAFVTSGHLNRHMTIHVDDRNYICKECGRAFKTQSVLKNHEKTHIGAKPAQCPICEARFANTAYIKVHMRTHTGERPFVCDLCSASFKESGKLVKHKRAHHK